MIAAGIRPDDQVITTPFSFVASANCILYVGAKPVFADIDPRTLNLDPDKLDPMNRARRADGDFPVVWAKQYGKGRVFNVGWGHPDATWDDPRFQKMILEGIKWAMGITQADITPKPSR